MTPPTGPSHALRSMVIWDVRLQVRHGFYAVYAVVTLFYLLVLGRLPAELVEPALVLVLVTDTAVLGFYFVGALVLIEKREGVLDALVVSPLGVDGYLVSKTASLTLLATLASALVVGLVHPPGVDLLPLFAGVVPTASLFVLVGVAAVARFDTMNRYFFGALLYGVVLYAPLAGYLDLFETPLFYLLPVQPALVLVAGAFDTLAPAAAGYALAYLAFGNAAAYLLARRGFRRHVLQGAGTGGRPGTRDRTPGRLASRIGARVGPVGGLALADARNWIRDPMLLLAATGPLALGLVADLGLPVIGQRYPGFDLSSVLPVVLAFLVAFPPYVYGFVVGFLVLEDREQGTLSALLTSPIAREGYLRYRGSTAYLLGLVGVFLSVALFDPGVVEPVVLVGVAPVAALGGPAIAFLFASLASDSIEGVAINKLLGLAVVVPALAILALPEPIEYVAGLDPLYWPMKAVIVGAREGPGTAFVAHLALGAASLGALVVALARRFDVTA